jgi:hypothetical protein
MPLVIVNYKPNRGLVVLMESFSEILPAIVAANLTLSDHERHDGQVAPEDIMIWCREAKRIDANGKDFEIVIFAHEYVERKANLEERKDAIIHSVREYLLDNNWGVKGSVWVLLAPTAYGEI